jgi:hypothetical protein
MLTKITNIIIINAISVGIVIKIISKEMSDVVV